MKKHLLVMSMVMAAMTANAQTRPVATISTPTTLQAPLYCVSANGKYAAGDFGAVSLLDLETGEETVFYDAANEGSSAKGVTNDGTIVGQFGVDLSAPGAVLKKGADSWTILPVPEEVGEGGEFCPQGVTPDGKYIAGYCYDMNKGMYVPLMWNLQDDGSYGTELLPYPETDLWGMQPQMTVLYGLSNDGTKAYGKMVDFTGFCTLGILYTKGEDGTWTYRLLGEDWLIKNEGAENPGPQPQMEDYVTAEPGTDEYWQQVQDFDFLMMDWNIAAEAYAKISTSPSSQIQVNQNSMSGNGKWMVMATPDAARRYNIEDGTYVEISGSAGQTACSVTDNGDVMMASPLAAPFRSSYICPAGTESNGPQDFVGWLETNYEVIYAEGTEDGSTMGLGTCCVTPDGKTFVGWNAPMQPNLYYVSSIVRIDGTTTSIMNIDKTKEPIIEGGVLYIPEGTADVSIYEAGGSLIAAFTAEGSTDLSSYAKGIVVVKVNVGKLTKTFKLTL